MDFLKMTDREIIEKIYRKLDGELTNAEQLELENLLAGHPEMAQLAKELKMIELQMNESRNDLPDIDVKQEILNRINMETYKQPPSKETILVVRSFWSRPVVRFGFAFVLGMFAGFLMFSFLKADLTSAGSGTEELKGTMYNPSSFDNMKTADVLLYESPLAKAICNVRYSSQIVEVRVDLNSLYPVKSTLEFDYNNFRVLNVQNLSVNDQSTAMAASNFIQINNVGDNKYVIQLLNKNSLPHNIDFKIYQNDSPIYQNSVQVNKE
jgi:hypothetical protein